MGAQLRVLRRRIKSAGSIKKITKAQELIATSRIGKAQARVESARPYAEELTKMLSTLAGEAALDHPLLVARENPRRAGVLVVTSDRGLCGGYNANVLRVAEELQATLRAEGKTPVVYAIGRKGLAFYTFRNREIARSWTGFSERPEFSHAKAVADDLVTDFLAGSPGEGFEPSLDGPPGVDELHIVYTEFKSMLTQSAVARRIAPMDVEYEGEGPKTLYDFEPDAETLFNSLLPRYLTTRVYAALLDSSASESASRRRAMKAATDNANELIRKLKLEANRARQAQITQEISEIVGGVDALAAAAGSDD
ncbi:MAG: F0F1 ATP synthase subunit gamma [Nocardiaceae bacterium]|nr:F0F1 ATP synthase subunit gamma [Nocardiaceae bacterium]